MPATHGHSSTEPSEMPSPEPADSSTDPPEPSSTELSDSSTRPADSATSEHGHPSRRNVLSVLCGAGATLLAGCADSTGGPTPSESTPVGSETTTDSESTPGPGTASTPTTSDDETTTEGASGTTVTPPARRVLYLYGDVSAEGDVPSGDAEPYHQMRLTDTASRGLSGFRDALVSAGFAPEERYDAETRLTSSLLDGYDVLILGSNQRRFDESERRAVRSWVEAGGGLLAWSDSAFGGSFREVGVCNPVGRRSNNDLTAQFGMTFLRDNGAGNYRIRRYTRDHFINAGDANGGVVFRGEGVSCVRVSGPATMLARLQVGGLDGELRVCSADAPYRPDQDAALAVATVGEGRVVGTFDRNTFWNGGPGTDLSEVDNREYAQRLVQWAAGDGGE